MDSLSKRFESLLFNELHSDLKLIVRPEDGEEETIPAHKCILSTGSSHIKNELLFLSNDSIVIDDIEPKGMREVLRYIYTNDITSSLNDDNVLGTWKAANKFLIKNVSDLCAKFLSDKTTDTNVWQNLHSAHLLNNDSLIEKCCHVIRDGLYYEHDIPPAIELPTIECFLKNCKLDATQWINFYKRVDKWSSNRCRIETERHNFAGEVSHEEQRLLIESIAHLFKFTGVYYYQFRDLIKSKRLFSKEVCFDIFMTLPK